MTAAPRTPGGTCVMQPLYLCSLISANEHGLFPVVQLSELPERVPAKPHVHHFKIQASFKIDYE